MKPMLIQPTEKGDLGLLRSGHKDENDVLQPILDMANRELEDFQKAIDALDRKATSVISFVGIIVGLSPFSSKFLSDASISWGGYPFLVAVVLSLFLVAVVLFLLTIALALGALRVRSSSTFGGPNEWVKQVDDEGPDRLIRGMIDSRQESIEEHEAINNSKGDLVTRSFVFAAIGLLCMAVAVCLAVYSGTVNP